MFKKFLNGIIFGAGFAVAFIAVINIYFTYFFDGFSRTTSIEYETASPEVTTPPMVKEGFLGSTGMFSGDYMNNKGGVLAAGPGKIVGKVVSNGQPTKGLKLRLALNGSVLSQWATTDSAGQYSIAVPYGEYKIDGFDLDHQNANTVLAGLIHSTFEHIPQTVFTVSATQAGPGMNFSFSNPVKKTTQKRAFTQQEAVVLSWEAYEGAATYRIQVREKESSDEFARSKALFTWTTTPHVDTTSVDLTAYTQQLKPGHFYSYEVTVYDANQQQISRTADSHRGYDFEIN